MRWGVRTVIAAVCLAPGRAMADVEPPPPIEEVTVRTKAPPRSASDSEVDREVIESAPHESGADVLNVLPGIADGSLRRLSGDSRYASGSRNDWIRAESFGTTLLVSTIVPIPADR